MKLSEIKKFTYFGSELVTMDTNEVLKQELYLDKTTDKLYVVIYPKDQPAHYKVLEKSSSTRILMEKVEYPAN